MERVATAGPDSDLALVARLQAGDTGGLERLMERHAARVYRLVHGITRNVADAEEVVQDVFLTVVRKIGDFEGRAALGTWIYRIAANAALNKRRGKRAEVELPWDDVLPTYTEDGHRAGDRAFVLADWSQAPDEELLSGERRAAVSRSLGALPDHYRAVLVLRDVEGVSSEEAADILGESVASVKSRLHRARMALREQLTRAFAP
jgi:RNA polymerase sigma-70 factor, ECF subfamily